MDQSPVVIKGVHIDQKPFSVALDATFCKHMPVDVQCPDRQLREKMSNLRFREN